ncbi:MAG: NAD-dependent epimerase/dehydratase family protein [Acidobacteria bacterium]|nr:MAG: NAD-dependent epimerase/dehydratase family protein [Acidobacteriota bacterium]
MDVVTGAAGHVGANLVRALLARNRPVRACVHRDERALAGLPVERAPLDLLDRDSVRRAVSGADIVFHAAARIFLDEPGQDEGIRVNVEGTRNVIEACREAGVRRLVHVSSVHALEQRPHDSPLDADRALAEETGPLPYDRSKARAERLVLEAVARGLDAVIVAPGAVIGPFDFKPSRMGRLLLALARGRVPALARGGYTWVDARDVAEALIAAAERGTRGRRYLVSGPYATFAELARLVGEASGTRPPRIVVPLWLARLGAPFAAAIARFRGETPLYSPASVAAVAHGNPAVDIRPAARDLGFRPRPLESTVADTIAWFRQAGLLEAPPRR